MAKAVEAGSRPSGRSEGRWGVAKAVVAWPRRCGVAKIVGAGLRPWRHSQSREAWPRPCGAWPWPSGRGQTRGGVDKPAAVWSSPWGDYKTVGRGQVR